MRYTARTAEGMERALPPPASVRLTMDEDAPADALTAVFPGSLETGLAELCVYGAAGETVFDGIVDEQNTRWDASGERTELCARSRAALLLDNESEPQNYYMPSLGVLFERHAAPYGFTAFLGDGSRFNGSFAVKKGMSEWEVLRRFCAVYLGREPRVRDGRVLDASGAALGAEWVLGGDCPCVSLEERFLNTALVSGVWEKGARTAAYREGACDPVAVRRGVRRRRFLKEGADAETLFEAARRNSYELEAVCPGSPRAPLFAGALVRQGDFQREGLYLSRLEYRLGAQGETCRLLLRAYPQNICTRQFDKFCAGLR